MTTLTNDIKIAIQSRDYEEVERLLDYSADNGIGFRSDEVVSFILDTADDKALLLFLQFGLVEPIDTLSDRQVLDYIIEDDLVESMGALLRWGDVSLPLSSRQRQTMSSDMKRLIDDFSKMDVLETMKQYDTPELNLASQIMGYVDNRHVIVNHISSDAFDTERMAHETMTAVLDEIDSSGVGYDIKSKDVWEEDTDEYLFSIDIVFNVDTMEAYDTLNESLTETFPVSIRFEHL